MDTLRVNMEEKNMKNYESPYATEIEIKVQDIMEESNGGLIEDGDGVWTPLG